MKDTQQSVILVFSERQTVNEDGKEMQEGVTEGFILLEMQKTSHIFIFWFLEAI